jgi:hypothetical protein
MWIYVGLPYFRICRWLGPKTVRYPCNEPATIVVEIMVVDYPPHMGCEEMAY